MSSEMIENYLASEMKKFKNKVDATLNEEEKKEYYVNLSLTIHTSPLMSSSEYPIKNPKIAGLFARETEMYNHRDHIRRASKESVLVYLVIIFEEFLNNLLSALLSKRHDVLKGSGKTIRYAEALEHTDIYELVKTMSKEEAKDIVESDIEELNKHLEKRFHLCLSKRQDWPKFKEFFYRRNIVVHNYCVPDSTYIAKTKFKGEKNYSLEIDNTYINEAFSIFENYADQIAHFFGKKYGHQKKRGKE
jgi:hypothetical protein